MNLERTTMKGQLAGLEERRKKLRLRIEGNCAAVRNGLNTLLNDIDDLNVPVAAEQMDELVMAWGELQSVNGKIARLNRELE